MLRFIFEDLSRQLGKPTWPDVVSGTSVGALNAVFAAARQPADFRELTQIWRRLTLNEIYRLAPLKVVRELFSPYGSGRFSLFAPEPFARLIHDNYPERSLREAIDSGQTKAFVVATTKAATGRNAIFIDSAKGVKIPEKPGTVVFYEPIRADHCRASAAIPMVFPPVWLGGHLHVDGGVRQNTPLRPVLDLGVDRALVITVKQDQELVAQSRERLPFTEEKPPSVFFLAGKLINALMLDPIERDLANAEYRNRLIAWGEEVYGAEFAKEVRRGLGLREVALTHISPSEDLAAMAGTIYRARPPRASRAIRFLMDQIVARTGDSEFDLLSYLYLDREYTAALEQLGYEDARRQESMLAALYL